MKKNIDRAILAPQPVLIVATYDENGTPDAMNAAWGGQCAYHHLALNLAKGHKTTENIRKTGAFTVSLATVATMVISDYFGLVSGHKEDKISKAGVTILKSRNVNAPVIEEYPLTMECKVVSINEEQGEIRVVGEIVNTIADETILDKDGKVDIELMQLISFDAEKMAYRVIGNQVGKAFNDGNKLK